MADLKNFRLLTWSEGKKRSEAERLDRFLSDLADPGLIGSLKKEEQRRRRRFGAIALFAGVLLGAFLFWLAFDARRSETEVPVQSAEETAHSLTTHGHTLSKQLPQAWSELQLATTLAPRMVEAWDGLALAYFYSSQTQEAVRCLNRCLEIEPGYKRGLHLLGDVYFYSGRPKEAEKYWLQARDDRGVARLRLLQGRMPEAVPLVRKLAAERPDDLWVQVMVKAVDGGQLTPDLRWRLEPGYVLSWNPDTAKSWQSYYNDDFPEASVAFSQVLAAHPEDDSAMLGKGWSLLKIASPAQARSYFERVLARQPANYSALNGLGWALKAEGQCDSAVKTWERLWSLQADTAETAEALRGLGTVYFDRGDYRQANLYLAHCMARNPGDKVAAALLVQTAKKLTAP
ncbi:MAG TPA: tetratricopeptide repeat protein [Thermoanaerobaculia bacterium]|nr:tetratricopeptide repeat protein [Thermoanaerobaculia bacterium]